VFAASTTKFTVWPTICDLRVRFNGINRKSSIANNLSPILPSSQWPRVKTGWNHFYRGAFFGGLYNHATPRAQRTAAAQLAGDQPGSKDPNAASAPAHRTGCQPEAAVNKRRPTRAGADLDLAQTLGRRT
jgi:hypothetical protein